MAELSLRARLSGIGSIAVIVVASKMADVIKMHPEGTARECLIELAKEAEWGPDPVQLVDDFLLVLWHKGFKIVPVE